MNERDVFFVIAGTVFGLVLAWFIRVCTFLAMKSRDPELKVLDGGKNDCRK